MFQTLEKTGCMFSFLLLYLAQLLLCYPVIVLAGKPFEGLASHFGFSGDHPFHIHFAGYEALICFLVGTLVGWSVGRAMPSLVSSGRWIWFLPAAATVPAVISAQLHSQPVPWLPEMLFDTGGEGGLAIFFFMLPACCATGYSLGMTFAGIKSKPGGLVIVLCAASVLVFCVLAPLLHKFEDARVEKWSKVRYVLGGLWLSGDPRLLCTGSSGGSFLPALTMVESLESRNCGGDQLLEPGASARPRSWSLVKVRVLSGPSAGMQGWVLAYGLLETVKP